MHIVSNEAARAQAFTDAIDQRVRDAQARAQALGFTLHVANDGFVLCHCSRTRLLPDLDAVDGVLEQAGGKRA